jgi:acetyl-CoA acetyltransferase
MLLLALTHHNGIRIAELGFVLAAVAGAALVLGAVTPFGRRAGNLFGGLLLAGAAVLLIVATHWGRFG